MTMQVSTHSKWTGTWVKFSEQKNNEEPGDSDKNSIVHLSLTEMKGLNFRYECPNDSLKNSNRLCRVSTRRQFFCNLA